MNRHYIRDEMNTTAEMIDELPPPGDESATQSVSADASAEPIAPEQQRSIGLFFVGLIAAWLIVIVIGSLIYRFGRWIVQTLSAVTN